jgi:hypothetical protein
MKPYLTFIFLLLLSGGYVAIGQPYGCHLHDHEVPRVSAPDPVSVALMRSFTQRSDTADILHYTIRLDVTDFSGYLKGHTDVLLTPKLDELESLTFDLASFQVDSIKLGDVHLAFAHQDPWLSVTMPEVIFIGDTLLLSFYYQGEPLRDPIWGGFYFEQGYAYNLGIGISSNPPNFGRAWYPCFDNFVERATYDIHVLSSAGRRGYAVGDFMGETQVGQDSFWRHYRMELPLPTYLTNVAVSNYVAIRDTHYGHYGPVPIEILARPNQVNQATTAFSRMGEAIDAIESWYGPYPWSRVGYVITTRGAMEHPTNTAFPVNSLNNGFGDVRLMTHELGHHWWGNITTLREPTDMWIKEGNAEYTAHLLDEWAEGRASFVNTVRSNHLVVLTQVHQQDGDFLPLSGLPFENIYGRHTYLKGAAMLHNMRGYLGDSLFKVGQNAILNDFPFSAIDAPTYRDHLTLTTGVDMGPFFDAWIFSPGYASFKVVSWDAVPVSGKYEVEMLIQQGLRAAPEYHLQVPLEVSFYSSTWERYQTTVMAGGPMSLHKVELPFEPIHIALNENYTINQARMDHQRVIRQPGNNILPFVRFRINVQSVSDSALVRVEHHWVAPDPILDQPELKISGTNYWIVSGIFPGDFQAQGRLSYDATSANAFLDEDIITMQEDSILLLYRANATEPWEEYPTYSFSKIPIGDGKGDVIIQNLQPGEYALARGRFISVGTEQVPALSAPVFFPNPVQGGQLFVKWPSERPDRPVSYDWMDSMGRLAGSGELQPIDGVQACPLPHLGVGLYALRIYTDTGEMISHFIHLAM